MITDVSWNAAGQPAEVRMAESKMGCQYDDIEPANLPDGGIVFGSSRCHRWVMCWKTSVAILYRCDADGGNIRRLSSNAAMESGVVEWNPSHGDYRRVVECGGATG